MGGVAKPEWWPKNPYFERIFTMTQQEFVAAIPDVQLRTRIAGFCMREGWNNASDACFEAWKAHIEQSLGGSIRFTEDGLQIRTADLGTLFSYMSPQGTDETP